MQKVKVQEEGDHDDADKEDSSSLISLRRHTKPVSYAFESLNPQKTEHHYKKRMGYFFDHLKIPPVGVGKVEEQGQAFLNKSRDNPEDYVEECIIDYFRYQKGRVHNHELKPITLKILYAPIKLFCEMHRIDKSLNWKILSRRFPKSKAAANDRGPTHEEIRKLIEYPDHRIRPIVLVMISSGIKLGAWDYLKWKHVTPIWDENTGKLL